ncbi:iron chelate uptake ABC transporter family permease subunit [Corynebacterium diphtheriae]|uniref:iron chelate uptake ABC transporter family permease subunit n=1 Tax=Corynebacterium diphtheriae TaxID=1717 RepID=UPI00202CCBD1|nr:iron chelate uptake ABC transporter family permease subunit [Corynebacterium diphtheriae]MCM0157952.1 iron chelate uptake ABC transporter family permease subunit [Corynebacterium diphtheriae]
MQTLKLGPLAFLYHRRVSVAGVILALLALVVWTVSLGVGEFPLSPVEVLRVLTGGGEKLERTVVIEWRLARSLVALAVGAALGLSGAITQRRALCCLLYQSPIPRNMRRTPMPASP